MKSSLVAASCLLLAAPAVLEAQSNPDNGRKPPANSGSHPSKPSGGNSGGQPSFRPSNTGGPGGPGDGRPSNQNWSGGGQGGPGGNGGNRPGGGGAGRPGYNPGRPGYNPGRPGYNPGRPGYNPGRPGYNPGRPGVRPGRPNGWRWSGRRFHGRPFYYPQGYGYRRWGVGEMLPFVFLSQAYFYANYADFGLYDPPWGYQWVRYGPDMLLVDTSSGQVVDVEYGVFY